MGLPTTVILLALNVLQTRCQQCQPSSQPSPCSFTGADWPQEVNLHSQDPAARASVGGLYKAVPRCFHNGAPLYSRGETGGTRHTRQVARMLFPGEQHTAALVVGEDGRWRVAQGDTGLLYRAQAPACTPLANISGVWREEGVPSPRLLTLSLSLPGTAPLYYHITGAPLDTVGYYSKTDLQMGGGEAPVYSKPGEGSSKLYLFYYKGSWVVAKDPFAGPSTMQYRMFQDSDGSPLPLQSLPWTVRTNSGSLVEDPAVQVLPVAPSTPGYYTLESETPAVSSLGGRFTLVQDLQGSSSPVYRQQQGRQLLLFQSQAGHWVVAPSLSSPALLSQDSKGRPSPHPSLPWRYYSQGYGWLTDPGLRLTAEPSPEVRAAAVRLAVSTLLPILAILLLLLLLVAVWCCCRRCRMRRKVDSELPVTTDTSYRRSPVTLRKVSRH